MTTEETIRAAVEAYDRGNSDRVAELVSSDVCYTINSHPDLGPYRADCRTRAEFFDAVSKIQADWNIDSYKIDDLIVNGNRGAAQIALTITSKHTGRSMDTRLALFLTVKDGQLSAIHEYHDTANAATARVG